MPSKKQVFVITVFAIVAALLVAKKVDDQPTEQPPVAELVEPASAQLLPTATDSTDDEPTQPTRDAPDDHSIRILRGRLVGLLEDRPWIDPLYVHFVDETGAGRSLEPIEVVVRADGTFEAEVDRWHPAGDWTELEIRGQQDGYVPLAHSVSADLLSSADSLDEGFTIQVSVPSYVTGVVLDSTGRALHGALVAAFQVSALEMDPYRDAQTLTDEQGRYQLALSFSGDCFLVAAVHEELVQHEPSFARNWLPDLEEVKVAPGDTLHALPLVLRSGEQVSGQVSWKSGDRVASAIVVGEPYATEGCAHLEADGASFLRTPEGVVDAEGVRATTTEDGQYVLHGLPGSPCRVRVEGLHGALLHDPQNRRVVYPSRDKVDFVIGGPKLVLKILQEGQAAERARVSFLHQVNTSQGSTSDSVTATAIDGSMDLLLNPGSRYSIQVEAEGFLPQQFEYQLPGDGSQDSRTIDLEASPRRSLRILAATTSGSCPETLLVKLEAEGSPATSIDHTLKRGDGGSFLIDPAPQGRFLVQFEVPTPTRTLARFVLPGTFEVVIPERGEITTSLTLQEGGCLELRVRDERGIDLPATCTLSGGADPTPLSFFHFMDSGHVRSGPDVLPAGGPSESNAVPVGQYTLHLEYEGFRAVRQDISVRSRQVTSVQVTLPRR